MGLWSLFKKDPRANHNFDEKDRELGAERRRLNIEIENLKKQHTLDEMRAEHALKMARIDDEMSDYDDDDEPAAGGARSVEDEIALRLIDRIPKVAAPSTTNPPAAPAALKRYTDEEIAAAWERVPAAHRAMVPKCTDPQISEYVTKQLFADADPDTLARCVKVARG